ncbi:hypothetical protein GYMLUDRAFT_145857, partial [Collybiopsis luxurians FD-317 M1]
PAWNTALQRFSDYNQSLRTPPDVNSGFWLPPARLVVSAFRQDTVKRLLNGWLKIRDITLYQLENFTCTPFQLTVKQWRSLLELCAGGIELSSNPNTKTGRRNIEVQKILQDSLATSALSLDMGYIISKSTRWRSQELVSAMSDRVVTEILWELCEINFRLELMCLDSYLDVSRMDKLDRQRLLENCWIG